MEGISGAEEAAADRKRHLNSVLDRGWNCEQLRLISFSTLRHLFRDGSVVLCQYNCTAYSYAHYSASLLQG